MKKIWLAGLLAVAAFSGAYASEIATEVAVPQIAGAVNEDVQLEALLNENTVSSASKAAAPLGEYFTVETAELQKAGQAKLAQRQDELYERVQKMNARVRKMADDGVVTSYELANLKEALKSYDILRSYANEELAFYRLSILENEQATAYWKLALIMNGQFSTDDQKESIRRFFVNLTGKDIKIKMGIPDKVGLTFMGSVGIAILVLAL